MAGIDHRPIQRYRGRRPGRDDLIGGQVQMMIDVMPNVYPLAKEGRIRRHRRVGRRAALPGRA